MSRVCAASDLVDVKLICRFATLLPCLNYLPVHDGVKIAFSDEAIVIATRTQDEWHIATKQDTDYITLLHNHRVNTQKAFYSAEKPPMMQDVSSHI